jgi:hypothetical protein
VTNAASEELEGTTLSVYAYVVKEGKPVGPRDVMRGANLSSPSVAYRNLQKLEALGLLQKNEYGEYIVKEKASVSGHLWIGRNLVPRLMFYSFFFMGVLATEIAIITIQFLISAQSLDLEIVYLITITAIAMSLFLAEGILLLRKTKRENPTKEQTTA